MEKPRIHYTDPYLLNPMHPVTVNLIGAGGTGSMVLQELGRMHVALKGLGHPGLQVRVYDADNFAEANVGRQLCAASEVGINKAVALVTRVNRFYGTDWEARPEAYAPDTWPADSAYSLRDVMANLTLTCVDSAASRLGVHQLLQRGVKVSYGRHYGHPIYWLDFGNTRNTGQAVLGTVRGIAQPKGGTGKLPTIIDLYPNLADFETADQGPSCSLAEALGKQDLFVNRTVAALGMALLWRLFRELSTDAHGVFFNLQTLKSNPLLVPICQKRKIRKKARLTGWKPSPVATSA